MENSEAMLQLVKNNAPDFWVDNEYENKVFIMQIVPEGSEYDICFTAMGMNNKMKIYRVQNPISYGKCLLWQNQNNWSLVTKYMKLNKEYLPLAMTHNFDRRANRGTRSIMTEIIPDWEMLGDDQVICVLKYCEYSGSEEFDKNWYATYVISKGELNDTALNLV